MLLAALPVVAQSSPEPSGPGLVARLKSARLDLGDAAVVVAKLQVQPLPIRLQASIALCDQFLARKKLQDRLAADWQRELAKNVGGVVRARLGKALEPATELRSKALAISSRENLTKDKIEQEIDPLVAQIEQLLWPSKAELETQALGKLRQQVLAQRNDLQTLYRLYAECTAGLELHPDAEKHFLKHPAPPLPPSPDSITDETTVGILLALPLSERDRNSLLANEPLRSTTDAEEFAGTTALQRIRFLLGLPLLRLDEKLAAAARDHATDMVSLGFFDHSSPVAGKRTPSDRAANFGTSGGAENIANGQGAGAGAIRAWWYSPGHHRNMLGGHARTGLGRHEQTWTQMFGG
jgi:uncharacterized protein YkwD